jgi:hypothetical protein
VRFSTVSSTRSVDFSFSFGLDTSCFGLFFSSASKLRNSYVFRGSALHIARVMEPTSSNSQSVVSVPSVPTSSTGLLGPSGVKPKKPNKGNGKVSVVFI